MELVLSPENTKGIHIPLRKTLKIFLEILGVLKDILEYVQHLSSKQPNIISNIMQANLWKSKYLKKFSEDIVLPIVVSYDELEVGNALGAHAGKNKFGAAYAYIACLPPHIASKLDAIILALLVRA